MDKNHHTAEDIISSRRASVHPVVRKKKSRKSEQPNGSEELQPLKPPHFHHTCFSFFLLCVLLVVATMSMGCRRERGVKRKRKGSANKKHKHSPSLPHTHTKHHGHSPSPEHCIRACVVKISVSLAKTRETHPSRVTGSPSDRHSKKHWSQSAAPS